MMSKQSYITLYTNIIPVKGYSRSMLMDLYKGKFLFIPNYLCDFLLENKNTNLQRTDFLSLGRTDVDFNEINELINELIVQDYLIETDLELIELLNVEIQERTQDTLITDCIMEISQFSNWNISQFLSNINHLGVKFLEVRFLDFSTFVKQLKIIQSGLQHHSIEFLHVIVPFDDTIKRIIDEELLEFRRLNQLTIYNTKEKLEIENTPFLVHFSIQENMDTTNCGCIHPNYFSTNVSSYYSNKKNNSCLSNKLSVDQFGDIKNCPSKKISFGKAEDLNLEQIIQLDKFQEEWCVTKESILVCSDCEFRWMCSDCRVFIQDESNPLSKPSKCGYNPYINKWMNEVGYVTESECGVSIVDSKVEINREKLNQIKSALWA